MKQVIYLILVLGIVGFLSSCSSNSKAKTWSAQQKKTWKTECVKLLIKNGTDKTIAEDRCDCLLKKTSEQFTPEEVKNITPEQEKKIWEECSYSW